MTTKKSTHSVNDAQKFQRQVAVLSLTLVAATGLLAGCGGMVNDAVTGAQTGVELKGSIFGGQQPVNGATIQLYAAHSSGTPSTGYATAATPLLTKVVTTHSPGGTFDITNDYMCPASPNDQVYLVATGGDSGHGTNSAIAMMAALGPCGNLKSSTFIFVNEVTTVASVYALSGFMSDYAHVGTSSTNYLGLEHAFATVNNLVDTTTGQALTVTPFYATQQAGTTPKTFSSKVPQAEIYTLANIIATCINSTGSSSAECTSLFSDATPSGGTAPTDTIAAMLDIAQNPGNNVSSLFNLVVPQSAPFAGLGSAPNDFTLAVNYVGGGMGGTALSNDAASEDFAIDGNGNLWIANQKRSTVTELDALGQAISPSTQTSGTTVIGGYKGGGMSAPNSIALDTLGNAWVVSGAGILSEITSGGTAMGPFTGGGLGSSADAVAIDGSNNIFVGSQSAISEFDDSGNPVSSTGFTANIDLPTSVSIDNSGNIFAANSGNGFVTEMSNTGTLLGKSGNVLIAPPQYSALDAQGQLWVPNGLPSSALQLFSPAMNNVVALKQTYNNYSSIYGPLGIAIDGGGNIFTLNSGNSQNPPPNVTELSSNGTLLSPAGTGYEGTGGFLTIQSKTLRTDASGNLWVLNATNSSSITEFVGLAVPTITPQSLAVKNAAIGTRP